MPDYGQDLRIGAFITPDAGDPAAVVGLARLAEDVGLDLVTFQDHPYQPRYLDTWTLLSFVAARTERVHLAPNVLNLPLRPPSVVARAAASLDRLSGGRFELGLGAGGFPDAVQAMGGPRRTPGEGVDALTEAIDVIRQVWDTSARSGVRVDGEHYRVHGAKRGPESVHPVELWLGAYKPRMLRLTGRSGDGWLPSLAYMAIDDLGRASETIDAAAVDAGRDPAAIRRLINVGGTFQPQPGGFLEGPPEKWVEDLLWLVREHGFSAPILWSDDPDDLRVWGEQVAPALRDAVARERHRRS